MSALYAKVISEKARKGQGGQKFIEVELYAFDQVHPVGRFTLALSEDEYKARIYSLHWHPHPEQGTERVLLKEGHEERGEQYALIEAPKSPPKTRGEKQKTESPRMEVKRHF